MNEGIKYNLAKRIPLYENPFRYGSKGFFQYFNDLRKMTIDEAHRSSLLDFFLSTDIGKHGLYEGLEVMLDCPMPISEAEYQGEDVELNKPKRGGSKKFVVYTKNAKGNVIKIEFGDTTGLKVKFKDPEARKNFASRHNCSDKKDKTKAGYWSCRLPRYAKSLGMGDNMSTFW